MKKVNIIILILIELCCTCCHFENLHNNHKLIKISDKELLEKENIKIESTINEFNEISKKSIELKEKIENEINKINKLYETTKDEIIKIKSKKMMNPKSNHYVLYMILNFIIIYYPLINLLKK